jgi:hypothetical protein
MTRGSNKRRKQERQEQRQSRQHQQGAFWSDGDDDSSEDVRGGEWNDARAAGSSRPNQNVRRNAVYERKCVTLCGCKVGVLTIISLLLKVSVRVNMIQDGHATCCA